jgi:RHS repeat-associated protein
MCTIGTGGIQPVFKCICEPSWESNLPPSNWQPLDKFPTPTGATVIMGAPGRGSFDRFYLDTNTELLDYFDTYYVDGSVTRFQRLSVPAAANARFRNVDFWVSKWTVDAYDNKTIFEHDSIGRLTRIRHPNGVDEAYNYAPALVGSAGWDPTIYSGVEVAFSAPGAAVTDLSDSNRFYLFKKSGSQFRPFAGDQLYRVYSAKMPVLSPVAAGGQLFDLPADLVGTNRFQVTQFVYDAGGKLVETQHLIADSLLPGAPETTPAPVLQYTYSGVGSGSSTVYRVATESHVPSGHTWSCVYSLDVNDPKLVVYSKWTCSETGTEIATTYDAWRRPTSVVTQVSNSASGRPRSLDADSDGKVEPTFTTVNYKYGSCGTCFAKPTEIQILPSGRTWTWEYGAATGLVLSATYQSPAGSGSATETFAWKSLVPSELYKGYRLDSHTDAAGRVWTTTYASDVSRVDPAHGVKATSAQTTSPVVSTATPAAPVAVTTYFDVSAPQVAVHTGSVHQVRETGQVTSVVDGDGVHYNCKYDALGLLAEVARGGNTPQSQEIKTAFVYDAYGRPVQVKERVGSSKEQTLLIDYNAAGRVIRTRATVGSQQIEERLFYDQFGNLAVRLTKNLDAAGGSPATLKGAATSAREWLRDEWHYNFDRLVTAFEDRRPLNEGDSGALADAPDARFLRTDLVWLPRGLVSSIGLPNGATVDLTYDGYGTLYKRLLRGMAGEELTSRSFINNALEPVRLIEGVGASKLVTTIDRNSAGVVEVVHEPGVAHPGGSYPATFGVKFARHEFDTDILGQTTEARIVDATNSALMRKVRSFYDELGRVYRVEIPDVLGGPATAVQAVTWTGASKAAQVTDSAGRFVKRTFDALGRVTQVEDSRSGQANKIIYEFLDKTDLVARTKTNNFDEVAGAYVERVTAYTYDTLGRVTQVAVGATNPLVSQYTFFATGDVQTFTDPSGKVEKFLPDALGRLTQRLLPGAASIWNGATHEDFAGSATSRLIQEDGEGRFTTSIMDFAGRLRAIAEPGSTVMPTAAAPNQAFAKYFVYDGVSRVARIHTGEDGVVNFVRDGAGRVLSRIRGLVTGSATANDLVSAYWGGDVLEWDALGRPTTAVSMMGVEPLLTPYILEQFTYDGLGRKTAENFTDQFAGLNRIESKYVGADPFRREVNYLHGAGGTADDLFMATTPTTDGRMGTIGWATTSGAPKIQLAEYSHEGGAIRRRRTFIPTWTLGNFDTTYSYDQYGRMTSIAQSFNVNAGVEFYYDNASNLVGEKYKKQGDALAEGDRFAYDEHHRLAKAWLNSQSMTADPDTVAFQKRLTYGMDEANNRTSLAEKLGQAASETAVAYVVDGGVQGGTPPNPSNRYASVGGFAPAYDSRGNTRRTKSSAEDQDFMYTYDGLNRLSEVHESVASSSSSAMSMSSSWGGELEGGELFGGGMGLETGSEVPMTAEGLNAMEAARAAMMARIGSDQVALLQRAMDPTLLEEAVEPIVMTPGPAGPGAGAMSMSSMQSSSEPVLELRAIYVYDAFNRRVARFVPGVSYFSYTWDGWQEAEEYRNLVVGSQYVWGEQLDELVAYRHKADTANGTWANYYVAEGGAHCSSRILNSSGQVVEIQEYDPYGRTYRFTGSGTPLLQVNGTPNQVGAVGNPFGWKGHRVDGETGLVYMRNRYYHTGWGRFLTEDPLGLWSDSQCDGNGVVYVGGSPLTASDRFGLQTQTHHGAQRNSGNKAYDLAKGWLDLGMDVDEAEYLRDVDLGVHQRVHRGKYDGKDYQDLMHDFQEMAKANGWKGAVAKDKFLKYMDDLSKRYDAIKDMWKNGAKVLDSYKNHLRKRALARLKKRMAIVAAEMAAKRGGKVGVKGLLGPCASLIFVWGDMYEHGFWGGLGRNVPYAGPAYEAYELAQLAMREPTDEEIEAEVRQIEEESL